MNLKFRLKSLAIAIVFGLIVKGFLLTGVSYVKAEEKALPPKKDPDNDPDVFNNSQKSYRQLAVAGGEVASQPVENPVQNKRSFFTTVGRAVSSLIGGLKNIFTLSPKTESVASLAPIQPTPNSNPIIPNPSSQVAGAGLRYVTVESPRLLGVTEALLNQRIFELESRLTNYINARPVSVSGGGGFNFRENPITQKDLENSFNTEDATVTNFNSASSSISYLWAPTLLAANATSTTASFSSLDVTGEANDPHMFGSWVIGDPDSNVLNSPFVINASSAVADANMLGIAVNGSAKFIIDAEGDLFANTITAVGGVTLSDTTVASLTVEGSADIGDAPTDDVGINGRLTSSLVPKTNGQYYLGTTSLGWKGLHITDTLTLNGVTYTVPTVDGTANQALVTNGSGGLQWGAASRWTLDGSDITYDKGSVTAPRFIGTSTLAASVFPYASTTAISASSLTSGRVVYATTSGMLADSSGFTYNGTNISLAGSLAVLQSGSGATVIGDTTGNNRGSSAVDIQASRGAATQVASGANATAVGYRNTASGTYATAIGHANTVTGGSSMAIGRLNSASAIGTTASGAYNTASASGATAFGHGNTANASLASAFGTHNTASGAYSNAFGRFNTASNSGALSVGYYNTASASSTTAVGLSNTASGAYASTFGHRNTNAAVTGVVLGHGNTAGSGQGGTAIAVGYNNSVTASWSTAVGYQNTVSMWNSVAIGWSNTASTNFEATAVGSGNTASGNNSSAIGKTNTSSGSNSSAFGYNNTSSATDSSAFGRTNTASAAGALSVGYVNTASASSTVAMGLSNTASAAYNIAVGHRNTASTNSLATAFGNLNSATGAGAQAIGYLNTASASSSQAIGTGNRATAAYGLAVGFGNTSTGSPYGGRAMAFGINNTVAGGSAALAVGYSNSSGGNGSYTFGTSNTAGSVGSLGMGVSNTASGWYGVAIGQFNTASNRPTVAIGSSNTASAVYSNAIGNRNTASGAGALSVGYVNSASGSTSVAVGSNNIASAGFTTAIGARNTASGGHSLAIGYTNTAATYGVAVGWSNVTTASDNQVAVGLSNSVGSKYVVAVGISNTASGYRSRAFGRGNSVSGSQADAYGMSNTVSGTESMAVGRANTAAGLYTQVFGRSNYTTTTSYGALVVGFLNNNGTAVGFNPTTGAIVGSPTAASSIGRLSSAVGIHNTVSGNYGQAFGYQNIVSAAGASAFGSDITNSTASSTQIGPSESAKVTILGATGKVGFTGIGSSSPGAKLSITQASNDNIGGILIAATDNDNRAIYMDTSNNLNFQGGDGNTATLSANGTWTNAPSFSFLKQDREVLSAEDVYAILDSTNIEKYRLINEVTAYGNNADPQIGIILDEANPLLMDHDKDGKIIGYSPMRTASVAFRAAQLLSDTLGMEVSSSTIRSLRLDNLEMRLANVESALGIETEATVLNYFEKLGAKIVDGIAYFKNLVVETLTIGSEEKPTAITIYDKDGKPGCMFIENVDTGAYKIIPGVCDENTFNAAQESEVIIEDTPRGEQSETESEAETSVEEPVTESVPESVETPASPDVVEEVVETETEEVAIPQEEPPTESPENTTTETPPPPSEPTA